MLPHAALPESGGDTSAHLPPLSRVTYTLPSLLPVQITPRALGDSLIAKSVPPYSTPMLSGVSPPELCCLDLSFRVRSGEMTFQLLPPSTDVCTNWLPVYTRL